MNLKLNPEQQEYLRTLKGKKKKRKFILDCIIEQVEEENHISDKKKEMIKLVEDMIKNSNITIFPIYSSM